MTGRDAPAPAATRARSRNLNNIFSKRAVGSFFGGCMAFVLGKGLLTMTDEPSIVVGVPMGAFYEDQWYRGEVRRMFLKDRRRLFNVHFGSDNTNADFFESELREPGAQVQ